MRTRHRIPAIFSLSMLDVFCCALGCVILLWLWNDRMAKQRAKAASETHSLLEIARGELADTQRALSIARSQASTLAAERDKLSGELAAARSTIDQKSQDLKDAIARGDEAEDLLAKKQKEHERLSVSAAAAQKRVMELETLVREKEDRLAIAMRKAADLDDLLHTAEGRMKQLRSKAEAVPGLRSELDAKDKRLADADAR